jgi:hypothetical protein
MIDYFHDGLPPVAGGALEQSAWFLAAARFLKNDEMTIKAER